MTVYSIGDQARAFAMRSASHRIKTTVDTLTSELSSGEVADVAVRLKGNTQGLSNIEARLSMMSQMKDNAAEAASMLQGMQDAMGALQKGNSALGAALLAFAPTDTPHSLAVRAGEAAHAFQAAASHLNTAVGGRFLFAGTHSDTAPLIPADQILKELEDHIVGLTLTSAQDVATEVARWFDAAPGGGFGFADTAYRGSIDEQQRIPVGEGTSISLKTTALSPALRDELKALAMGALLDRGVLSGNHSERVALAQKAGEAMINNSGPLVAEMARVGIDQQMVERAQGETSAATAALTISRNQIQLADPYQTAAALSEAESQLEMLYTVTARLSRLKLVDFLS